MSVEESMQTVEKLLLTVNPVPDVGILPNFRQSLTESLGQFAANSGLPPSPTDHPFDFN